MDYNLLNVNGTVYTVKHMNGVGYYLDINGQATTKPTKAELLEELKKRYDSVTIVPTTSTGQNKG